MTELIARSVEEENGCTWKFRDPLVTAAGKPRAQVSFSGLRTLWFNTGTLCNVACEHCYIESSPTNDALEYLSRAEVATYLDELALLDYGAVETGFTGGEPFMNADLPDMLGDCLERGHRVLVLTNAMRPMMKCAARLLALRKRYGTPPDPASVARPLSSRSTRIGTGKAHLGTGTGGVAVAFRQRIQCACRRPPTMGGWRRVAASRFRRTVCIARHSGGCAVALGAGAVPGNGTECGCSRDHHGLLVDPWHTPVAIDVRAFPHGDQASGSRLAGSGQLHASAL